MKNKHLAFWIAFPIGFCLITLLLLFIFDLLNGPVALFVVEIYALVGLLFSSILIINQKKRFRLIPWGVFVTITALLIGFSKTTIERKPAALTHNFEKTEVLTLANGKVQGAYSKDKQVEIYAGIPYAKAPVGELRWKETQPVEDWEGVKDCTYFAPRSMQTYSNPIMNTLVDIYSENGWHPDYTMYPNEHVSEDSLYLNIWRPANFTGELPILVYIHGGSLTTGTSTSNDTNGETFAKNGVIMITIAYRLGVFGYFAHPDLITESPNNTTGNYGLLDQIEALKWVNANASYFGGDKNNITIAGESAGSSSVSAICSSPLATGLFKRAIGESSSVVSYRAPHTFRKLDKALETGQKIMKEMKCSSIEEMRKLPASKLVTTQYDNSGMCVDGYALPKTPYEIYQDGNNNEEALLNGYNVKEADAFVVPTYLFEPTNKSNIKERLTSMFDETAANAFMKTYSEEINKDAFTAFNSIISAYWFMQPHMDWSTAAVNNGVDVYRYQFTKENGFHSTYHAGEIVCCYGNLDKLPQQFAFNDSDYQLSKIMVNYWVNFIKTGNPNGGENPTWNKWTSPNDQIMELGKNVAPFDEYAKKAYPILDEWKARMVA